MDLLIAFDLFVVAFLLTAALRWYELEREWRVAKHPYLKEQNDQLKLWYSSPVEKMKREVANQNNSRNPRFTR